MINEPPSIAGARTELAARVLAGERPAEIRFDDDDRRIADEVARAAVERICRTLWPLPQEDRDQLQDAVFNAIRDYAHWYRDGGDP